MTQFPDLRHAMIPIPVEHVRPRFWWAHTLAESALIAALILFFVFV